MTELEQAILEVLKALHASERQMSEENLESLALSVLAESSHE